VRLFLSLQPQPELIQRLLEVQAALPGDSWTLKTVPPEQFHLTLHFLGETPERLLEDLGKELGACANRFRPFDLACGGLGAFPHWEDPRVLWIGVHDRAGKLKELFEATKKILNSYRLFKLNEDFQPHLSLARVTDLKTSWDPAKIQGLLSQWEHLGKLAVEGFHLTQSHLGPGGAKHEVLKEFKLKE
jgi:2'-5' RNA ligase